MIVGGYFGLNRIGRVCEGPKKRQPTASQQSNPIEAAGPRHR
jgi:hypothetical protein